MSQNQSEFYRSLGASPSKEEVHQAIANQDKGLFPGAFCKVLPDFWGHSSGHCLAVHADGAGTKSLLAYLYWKETGDISVFRGLAQDSLVMNLDDLLCVGATDHFVVSNSIGRNAHRIPGDVLKEIIEGYSQCAQTLNDYGLHLHLAGGETADVGDLVGTLIVDSTISVRFRQDQVVDASQISSGNVIVGLASFGKAAWEQVENSGMGSNGLTAARHALLKSDYAQKYPESFTSSLNPSEVFTGDFSLTDPLPSSPLTVGQALLSPTRTFAPFVKDLFENVDRKKISGLIHNSGGGLTKSLHFGSGLHYIKDQLFSRPPLFESILQTQKMTLREMCEVFNMGQRFEVYTDESAVEDVITAAKKFSIEAQVIGHVETVDEGLNRVTLRLEGQELTYQSSK